MAIEDLSGFGIGVTGGGGHLGAALARGLAEAGAVVVICGRTRSSLDAVVASARAGAGRIVPVVADLEISQQLERVLDTVEDEAGAVHGWVNNAYAGSGGMLEDGSIDEFRKSLESGVLQVMTTTQAVLRRMRRATGGSIVNVASMYGLVSPRPEVYADFRSYHNPPAYGAAKAGVLQFTRYAACHLAGSGIRVNAVSPGAFPNAAGLGPDAEAFAARLSEEVPLGRVGRPEELVGPVRFLLSDASSYVTGHNLVVDGGWTAW